MPTRALLVFAVLAGASGASPAPAEPSGSTLAAASDALDRLRPGSSSSGPRGVRRVDTLVEPASFRPLGRPEPLPPDDPADGSNSSAQSAAPEPTAMASPAANRPHDTTGFTPASADTAAPSAGRLRTAPLPTRKRDGAFSVSPLEALATWRPSSRALTATVAATAIAVGLLMSFAWLLRSLTPAGARALPREVVEVLGRAPLAGKQVTQLVRVGHKLVLVAITPEGAKALTEITDPDEVAQLVAACDAGRGRGATAEFDALLREMERQRTSAGLLEPIEPRRFGRGPHFGEAGFDPRSLAAAYANTPGGRGEA